MFFLQKEKKNLQDLNGVYVFNVDERDFLDRPTARYIKEFDCIKGNLQVPNYLFLSRLNI